MSRACKRIIILILLWSRPILAANGLENDTTPISTVIPWETQLNQVVMSPAIAFIPFDILDPFTQQSISPESIINVNGLTLTAGAYYDHLNSIERDLNLRGISLRNAADNSKISQLQIDMKTFVDMAKSQNQVSFTFDPKTMSKVKEIDAIKADIENKVHDVEEKSLREFETLANESGEGGFKAKMTPLDEKLVKQPNSNLHTNTHKEWIFEPGKQEQVEVSGKAVFHMGASKKDAQILATVKMDGKLLGQSFNLLYGYVEGKGNLATDSATVTIGLESEVYFNALGRERFAWRPERIEQTQSMSTIEQNDVRVDTSVFSRWLSMTGRDISLEPWRYVIFQSYQWYYMVGPVPGSASIGINGTVYLDWGSGINANAAKANLTFGSGVTVFAEGAVGVDLLKAGARSDLILVDNKFDFEGSVAYSLGDTDRMEKNDPGQISNLEPKIAVIVKGTRALTFLEGSVYAFAKVPMPMKEPPFFKSKTFTHELFDWEGYKNVGTIYSFKKVLDRNGFNLYGTPTEEDIQTLDLDKKLDEHFNAVLAYSDQHTANMRAIEDSIRRQNQVKKRFVSWMESMR